MCGFLVLRTGFLTTDPRLFWKEEPILFSKCNKFWPLCLPATEFTGVTGNFSEAQFIFQLLKEHFSQRQKHLFSYFLCHSQGFTHWSHVVYPLCRTGGKDYVLEREGVFKSQPRSLEPWPWVLITDCVHSYIPEQSGSGQEPDTQGRAWVGKTYAPLLHTVCTNNSTQ